MPHLRPLNWRHAGMYTPAADAMERSRTVATSRYRFRTPTEVIYGTGSVKSIGDVAHRYAHERVLIVTDRGVIAAGLLDRVVGPLDAAGLHYDVFDSVEPNPSIETVNRGIEAFRQSGAEALVAIGGGSSIDAAKAISVLATNGGHIADYE